jgi:Regulatory CLIP domain of proteinases
MSRLSTNVTMKQLSIEPVCFAVWATNFHSLPPSALDFRNSSKFQMSAFSFFFLFISVTGMCQTPDNKFGSCIPIKQCSSLLKILNSKPISQQNLQLLRKSQCDFTNNVVQVCCANEKPMTVDQRGQIDANKLLPDYKTCGAVVHDRIYGGEQTKVDEFPWTVLIQYVDGGCCSEN